MGVFLLLPFFLLRFGLLARLDRSALRRAAQFAPMYGRERVAYWVYQLSTGAVILYPLFLSIRTRPLWRFVPGLLGIVAVFQCSAHWIILAEERACLTRFGEPYARYTAQVRRYFYTKTR